MHRPHRPPTDSIPGATTRLPLVEDWRSSLRAGGEGSSAEIAARAALVDHDAAHGVRSRFAGRAAVFNDADHLLAFEYSGRRFILPGGGCDPGETFAQAAVREVFEETTRAATLLTSEPAYLVLHALVPDCDTPRVQYAAVFVAMIDDGPLETDGRPVRWLSSTELVELAPTYPMLAGARAARGGTAGLPLYVIP